MQGIPKAMMNLIEQVRSCGCGGLAAEAFERCIVNTWQTTIDRRPDGSIFVVTGDIPAMWLRDSSMQVLPYLRLTGDPEIAQVLRGIIRRQAFYIGIDPYANAFNPEPSGACWDSSDRSDSRSDWVWERKFEVDSLCFPLILAGGYATASGDWTVFGEGEKEAYLKILDVFETEQHHAERSSYRFERDSSLATETLPGGGRGGPVGYTGMIWSGFRPSDDACTYGYHVPGNMLACVALDSLRAINRNVWNVPQIDRRAAILQAGIRAGIERYALAEHMGKRMFCYETDGLGNHLWMDDANYPSLLSAPFFGYCGEDDPVYRDTRRFVLSGGNPYYYEGDEAAGIGSPHTPEGYIWPLALVMRGLTCPVRSQQRVTVELLLRTDGGTGYMHESFCKDDAAKFTRPWFSWANSMFCELILRCYLDEAN